MPEFMIDKPVKKQSLLEALVHRLPYSAVVVREVVDALWQVIRSSVLARKSVVIPGFGVFEPKTIPAQKKKNFNSEGFFVVPEHDVFSFRASKVIKKLE